MQTASFSSLPVPTALSASDPLVGKPLLISATDSNVIAGLSPLNWVVGVDSIHTCGGGASVTVKFTGANFVALALDIAATKLPSASRYPIIAWTVNGGPTQTHQLAAGETSVTLANGVPNPEIDLYLKGFSPFENRFLGDVPDNSVKITGFITNVGGRTVLPSLPEKVWLNIGDSILSGDGALYHQNQGRPADDSWAESNDGRACYGYLLAHHYGYRESRLAYGGYNWGGGLGNIPALSAHLDQITSEASRLKGEQGERLVPSPAVALINLGENGVPQAELVTNALAKLRLRTGPATQIIVMIPVSGKGRAEITNTFSAYKTSSHDEACSLVDLGTIAFDTADGVHPTAAGHRVIYEAARPQFDKIVKVQTAPGFPAQR